MTFTGWRFDLDDEAWTEWALPPLLEGSARSEGERIWQPEVVPGLHSDTGTLFFTVNGRLAAYVPSEDRWSEIDASYARVCSDGRRAHGLDRQTVVEAFEDRQYVRESEREVVQFDLKWIEADSTAVSAEPITMPSSNHGFSSRIFAIVPACTKSGVVVAPLPSDQWLEASWKRRPWDGDSWVEEDEPTALNPNFTYQLLSAEDAVVVGGRSAVAERHEVAPVPDAFPVFMVDPTSGDITPLPSRPRSHGNGGFWLVGDSVLLFRSGSEVSRQRPFRMLMVG